MHVLLDWQDCVALAITAVAALYLARRLAGAFRKRGSGCARGCSGCANDSVSQTPGAPLVGGPELVQIGTSPKDRHHPVRSRQAE